MMWPNVTADPPQMLSNSAKPFLLLLISHLMVTTRFAMELKIQQPSIRSCYHF